MAYVPNRLEVKVTLDLNSNDLHDALEKLVREAWQQGYQRGAYRALRSQAPMPETLPGTDWQQMALPMGEDYEDWRAFGPGCNLPGGAQFRSDLEQRE